MKSNWLMLTIGDVCTLITDGAHNSPKSVKNGYPMVSVKDFSDYGFNFSNCKQISKDDYAKLSKQGCVPKKGDILVGKDGARYFQDIIVYCQDEEPALLSSIAILRPNSNVITSKFLYYTLKSPLMIKNVRDNYGSGSAIPRIVLRDFKRMPLSIPQIEEQNRITTLLSSIDSKIKLNSEINNNLEQQAQTLFNSWFEDFIPFNGKTPSEWHTGHLEDIAKINTKSFNPAKNPNVMLEHYSIPAFDEKRYPVFELSDEIKSNKYILSPDSVLASKLNPDTKRVWRPICMTTNAVCSTEFIVFESLQSEYKDFLYSIIDSEKFSNWMRSHTTGSTNSRQRTTPAKTLEFEIVIPPENIIIDYCSLVTPIYNLISENIKENQRLATLRDVLLPQLMSGELDVSNIEL
ncbi:restriction endonuclease subunit S [uncultured Dubosiella sp.]|uniref:restriction endonuclease subunit S n=1 Tax=uncultured Dubosiella sp. TaxID=1937011 RepID=UPI002730EFD7|nr:restriction endonuclease subunit S [uncultured Dubosiella sp.]